LPCSGTHGHSSPGGTRPASTADRAVAFPQPKVPATATARAPPASRPRAPQRWSTHTRAGGGVGAGTGTPGAHSAGAARAPHSTPATGSAPPRSGAAGRRRARHLAFPGGTVIKNLPEEAQAGIKIAGRNINNLRYADDTTLMAESEEELKSLLMKVKVESEKVGLKFNIQKMKIMASGPITLWEIDGETVETVSDFIFGDSKITAYGDCSHEIKRHLLLGRKVMTNLDSIFKSRDSTLPTKVRLVKAMVSPVVMYGCESWTVKKAECRRIDAFELWC
uniref:Reverse transcriptase domain-containing protein n=1 Tax=Bos mutus grunniens TaxID=30521 RepID=A0A8B9X1X4_BOSMU